jgi:hypothetical protein
MTNAQAAAQKARGQITRRIAARGARTPEVQSIDTPWALFFLRYSPAARANRSGKGARESSRAA